MKDNLLYCELLWLGFDKNGLHLDINSYLKELLLNDEEYTIALTYSCSAFRYFRRLLLSKSDWLEGAVWVGHLALGGLKEHFKRCHANDSNGI